MCVDYTLHTQAHHMREVIRWAMCKLGVEEWLVSAVKSMYTDAKTVEEQLMVTVTVVR